MNHLPTPSLCFFLGKLGRVLPTGKVQGSSEKTMGVRRQVRLTSIPLSTADGGEDSRPHQLTDLPSYESLPMLPSQIRGKPGSSRRSAQNSPLPSSRTSKQACTVVEGHGHSPRESGNASLGLSRQTDAACHVTWASVFLLPSFYSSNGNSGLNKSPYTASSSPGSSELTTARH